MPRTISRRRLLQLALASGLGTLAACSTEPTAAPAPAATRILTTPTPGSLLAPTAAPTRVSAATPTAESAAATTVPATEAATAAPTATAAPALADDVGRAAAQFLSLLDDGQRTGATYAFTDPERTRWHWTTPRGFPRNGLPLREMTPEQRDQALALLQASVSPAGFQKALDIISLQTELGNDPELYYVSVFGAPGGGEPWGWRFEGHHLSRHFSVAGGQVSLMPFFLGAWPTTSSAGLKAMDREEWAARELVTALPDALRATAIFQPNTLTRHVTGNQPIAAPLDPVGILAGDLPAEGQALVNEIIFTYLNTLPEVMAQPKLAAIAEAGFENIRFGWAGPLEPRRPHYYRLQGPTFLLEHDNSRGGGTHIHSVWRDFADDFGQGYL